jgi:DNA recombination protein RmuC
MNTDIIIILFLFLVLCLLIYLLIKTHNKVDNSKNNFEIQKISQNLENLLNKTLEQTGYVNSKISEIGDLTKKMTNAMTSNISDMGDMGEVILENILEDCGMTKNRDYKTQFTGKNEEGSQFRPDVVVFLPENRNIIIDAKVPMKDWYEFQNTDNETIREEAIRNFINSIKSHINSIHKKDYKNLLNVNSPDYVFIFMPHEFAFVTAQKFDTTLANYAQQKQIIIVGPSTLIMCMKLIESIWKLEKQNKNSSEIANLAGQMYDQIIKSINILDDSEKNLMKAVDNVSSAKKFIKDGRGSLYSKAEEMKKLGANSKKELN